MSDETFARAAWNNGPRPELALEIALRHEGAQEDPGPPFNTGPVVTFAVERFTKRRPGEDKDRDGDGAPDKPNWAEWCAGFAWRCELDSGQDLELSHKPYEYLSCTSSWERAHTLPGYTFPTIEEILPGDLVWFGPADGHKFTHMGRVHRVDFQARVFYSIEGNAGPGSKSVSVERHAFEQASKCRRFARGPT